MFQSAMTGSKHVTTDKDIAVVRAKSADDLAQSIEFLTIECRAKPDTRAALRGVCCILRGEATVVTKEEALKAIFNMKQLFMTSSRGSEARILILQRIKEIIEGAA